MHPGHGGGVVGPQRVDPDPGHGQGEDHHHPGHHPGGQHGEHGPGRCDRAAAQPPGAPAGNRHGSGADVGGHRGRSPDVHPGQVPVGDSRTRYMGW